MTVYAPYLLGVCPFLLGFLFFWADMSRSALAYRHCSAAAFGLAVLFLWMKCWQAIFSARLRAHLCGAAPSRWPLKRILGLILTQAIWQTTGILVLLLAGIILVPFGWAYAFFQNLTVLEEPHPVADGSPVERASKQAGLRPAQNHVIISILSLFSLFVLINWVSALLAGPYLLRTVFGWETIFTRSGFSLFNTTFFAICIVLTFVAVDPVVKAVYLLRCFYGEAQQSGLDLKIALRRYSVPLMKSRSLVPFLLGGALVCTEIPLKAAEGEFADGSVPVIALDNAIEEVLSQPEYTWRMPRESSAHELESPSWLVGFLSWLDRWLIELLPDWTPPDVGSGELEFTGVQKLLEILVYVLLAGILVWILWRVLKTILGRRKGDEETPSHAAQTLPDLRRDDVSADELPSSAWLNLARELLENGEYRLALRAFYLSQLSQLADSGLIVLRRFKSNFDYQNELRRRAHVHPDLTEAFQSNSSLFEESWYGNHPVSEPQIEEFHRNLQKMKLRQT